MPMFGGDEESGGGLVRSDISTKSSLSNFIVSENYINKIEQRQPSFDNDINLAGQNQKKKGKLNEMFVLRNLKVMVKRD